MYTLQEKKQRKDRDEHGTNLYIACLLATIEVAMVTAPQILSS